MISKISSTICGASPIDGSSSRTIFGRDISARPIRSHLLLAARGVAGLDRGALEAGEIADRPAPGRRDARPPSRRVKAPVDQVLLDGQVGEAAPALHHLDAAPPHHLVGVRRSMRRRIVIEPLVTSPRSACSRLETALSVVVLPAPLAPSRATMPPGHVEETPFSTRMTCVDDLDVVDRREWACCAAARHAESLLGHVYPCEIDAGLSGRRSSEGISAQGGASHSLSFL